jgi:hypothetical protein
VAGNFDFTPKWQDTETASEMNTCRISFHFISFHELALHETNFGAQADEATLNFNIAATYGKYLPANFRFTKRSS